jgi:DNA-binding GntR family transcriptional regulator
MLVRRYAVPRWLAQRTIERLAEHGLLVRRPARGWSFPEEMTSLDAYLDGYAFRAAIEPAALRLPGYRVPPAEWARVRDLQRRVLDDGGLRLSRVELFRAGAEFHEAIIAWSGNRHFIAAIRQLNQVRRLFEYRAKVDRDRIRTQTTEHLKLLALIAEGEREEAARLLERHIASARASKEVLLCAGEALRNPTVRATSRKRP